MKHVRGLVLSLTMIALIVVALVVSAAPLALAAPQTDASVASACTPITPGTWTARTCGILWAIPMRLSRRALNSQ